MSTSQSARSVCQCMRRYASSSTSTPSGGRPSMARTAGVAHGGTQDPTASIEPMPISPSFSPYGRPSRSSRDAVPQGPPPPQELQNRQGGASYATWFPPPKRTDETPAYAQPRSPTIPFSSIPKGQHVLVSRVRIHAYTIDVSRLEFYAEFAARAADALGIPNRSRRLATDIQAMTIIRGPHVHERSKEAIWRRTHVREVAAYNASPSVVEAWYEYLKRTVMPGVGLRFETIGAHEPGFGREMGARAKATKVDDEAEAPAEEKRTPLYTDA